MRAYRIELIANKNVLGPYVIGIGDFLNNNTLILQQNMEGVEDGIHIEFETLSYAEASSSKTVYNNAVLSLYNVNRYWHNENSMSKLKNAKVKIWAGTIATPIQYHQGIIDINNTCYALNENQIKQNPIYEGYILNTYADMDGRDTVLNINLSQEKSDDNIKINQLNISANTDWRIAVQSFINNYLILNKNDADTAKIGIPSKNSEKLSKCNLNTLEISSIFNIKNNGTSLQEVIKKTYNEIIIKVSNIIYIGLPVWIDKYTVISDKDLLGQPQLINVGEIVITVPLTSKFKLLQLIQLEFTSFVGYNQAYITEGDATSLGLALERNNKMYQGIYRITKIEHILQSRNPNVNAWCTVLNAVKELS